MSTSHHLSNRPDIVLFDYSKEFVLFIKVSCPADLHYVLSKENEKLHKYRDLAHDFRCMYQMLVKVIPVVIGHFGAISIHCKGYLQSIPGYYDGFLCHLLKTAIIGTVHTLRTIDL